MATLRSDRLARESTLVDVAAQLNALGIPTVLDRQSLEDENISEDDLIRMPTASLSLGQGLSHALYELSVGWTLTKKSDAVVITTHERIEEDLLVVTYDVTPITRIRDEDSVINAITSSVKPDAWDDVGGPGSIQSIEVRGRTLLVVSAEYNVQLETLRLLNSLLQLGGSGPWSARVPTSSAAGGQILGPGGSTVIAMPGKSKKRGIGLPDGDGSTSGFGAGGMGGMAGGMF